MNTTRNRTRLSALAASALLAAGGTFSAGLVVSAPAAAEAPAASAETASFEVGFLKNMIDHHMMAIIMAQSCLEKADHEELVSLCQSIIDSQSAQVEQMQAWLQDWYGISYEPELSHGDMQSMQRMENFSGDEYEIRFMQSMIRHHWAAVREAEQCLISAGHEQLLQLCSNIREVQLQEIGQMQTWLNEWYDRNGGRQVSTA